MHYRLHNLNEKTFHPLTGLIKQMGRSLECDIVIPDPEVSRLHARLEKTGDDWVIVDLESRNGTIVNGEPVREKALSPGDVLQLGATNLKYEIDEQAVEPDESTRINPASHPRQGILSRFFHRKSQE